jgi:tRNA-splicing ligase RtcB
MQVITSEKIPIKIWADKVEEGTVEQAKHLANLPFAYRHVALMPDTHEGYGMPIGGVLATDGVVIPNAVGVDIGCGMRVIKTDIKYPIQELLQKIVSDIKEIIPVGFNWNEEPLSIIGLCPSFKDSPDLPVIHQEYNKACYQIGTLGGGNHFIEIQTDGQYMWVMLHSGSRNIGLQVANHYNKIASALNEKWFSKVPKEWQLAFLPLDSEEGQSYINEMQWCVDFAELNRQMMLYFIEQIIKKWYPDVTFSSEIDIAHNYAAIENHFGHNVIVHRKGATRARVDEYGIIPGSMGTKSYIVKGLGNPESFMSCSHGAGRAMGRKVAQRELSLKKEMEMLNNQGIIHDMNSQSKLDEAPSAYKDISEVMKNQEDLVEIVHELSPLAVIKG